jgi:hypothetical protein
MYELPEAGLSGLTDEALSALESDGLAAFADLNLSADSDEATVTEAERIAPLVREVRAELSARAERAAKIADLTAEMAVADEPEAEVVEEPVAEAAEEPVAEEAPVEEPAAEAEAEVVAEAEEIIKAEAQEPEPVAASVDSPVTRAARNAPAVIIPKEKSVVTLTAAADVPGFSTGQPLEGLDAVVAATVSRMRAFPTGRPNGEVFNRYGTAVITKTGYEGLTQDNPDFRDDEALIAAARSTSRLPGGSLVAAGGWCAPSESIYDLCGGAEASDLLSLPEIQVTRGGIRYTKGPDFSDIFGNVGFHQTETQAIAGTPDKTCYEVECPQFTEERLDAYGICIKAPILTNAAYPELVRHVIEQSLVAHELKINAGILASIKTALGTSLKPADQGSTISTLESLAWVAESIRTKYGLSDSATVEVIAPKWFRQVVREDLARRNGQITGSVSDAQVNAWFSDRNLAVQFVRGLADIDVSTALAVKPPATVDLLMYPAGSFIKGTSAVINLDSVYDSTGLVKNVYTALFVEEGVLVADKCYGGAAVTIPICGSGRSGAADLVACFGTAENAAP